MSRKVRYNSLIYSFFLRYRTVAPNGISASFASLKHCLPNGMPMIVMQNSTPITADSNAMGTPLKISQKMLQMTETAPPP